jgi:ribonuclease Z
MNAKHTILTHFSQRYPKIPLFDSVHQNQISIAFDLMVFNMGLTTILPAMIPLLRLMFSEETEDDEEDKIELTKKKSDKPPANKKMKPSNTKQKE